MAPTDQTSPPLLAPPDNPASWHGSLRRRLDLRIFALVLGFSVVLSLVTTSVWIWLAYRDQVTVIATNIDRIQSGFVAPLAQSLWEFDEEALAAEVKKIVSQPGIDFVQVITQTGKIFTAGRQLEHPLISRTIPISFNYLDRPVPVGTLVIVGDSRKVLAEIGRSIGPIYLFQLIMVGGVASFFFLLFNRMITQHLFDISRYLVKIGVSTEQPRLVLHRRRRNDELDLVADTVNAMREDLYAAQQALLESEERYRTMFEESQAVMLVIDPHDGSIVDANPAAAAYYGYPLDQLMTFTISMINTQTVQDIETDMQSAVAEEINSFRFRHRLASGEERDVQVFSSPISYKGGEYLYSIIQDITERVQAEHLIIKLNNALEQRVAERTAQLVAANHELEAFSYSVSHDLRAPVRHISAFAKMLAEASAPSFSAESQHFLQRILHSSALMGEMIEGLLQISRLNRTPLNLESVNLSGLAGEIAESCSAESTD